MDAFGPQQKGFDLGRDQLGKRRAVGFDRQKRQFVDVRQDRPQRRVGRIGGQLVPGGHGFAQDRLREAVRHTAEGSDGDDPAGMVDDLREGAADGQDRFAGQIR